MIEGRATRQQQARGTSAPATGATLGGFGQLGAFGAQPTPSGGRHDRPALRRREWVQPFSGRCQSCSLVRGEMVKGDERVLVLAPGKMKMRGCIFFFWEQRVKGLHHLSQPRRPAAEPASTRRTRALPDRQVKQSEARVTLGYGTMTPKPGSPKSVAKPRVPPGTSWPNLGLLAHWELAWARGVILNSGAVACRLLLCLGGTALGIPCSIILYRQVRDAVRRFTFSGD